MQHSPRLTAIHPKLPMRDKSRTRAWYLDLLGFTEIADYGDYWMCRRDSIEIHFFAFPALNPLENYGQVYLRVSGIQALYEDLLARGVPIHPNAPLQRKPWGQTEFALLDPDHNLLTFGEG